jgi:hypothetical protein
VTALESRMQAGGSVEEVVDVEDTVLERAAEVPAGYELDRVPAPDALA